MSYLCSSCSQGSIGQSHMGYCSQSFDRSNYASPSGLEMIAGSYNLNKAASVDNTSNVSYMAAESMQKESGSFLSGQMYNSSFTGIRKEIYGSNDNYSGSMSNNVTSVGTFYSGVDDFLNPDRPKTVFAGDASEIKEFVEDAFFKMTGKEFPDDIRVRLISRQDMEKMHPGNVLGFALNRKDKGMISEIFIKKDMLDRVMLTIGHELGHVLTKRLDNDKDEEAKAFAFSIAWMKTIKEHNIANLSTAIKLDAPAKNGLHDVALDFVLRLVEKGREALDIYLDMITKKLSMRGEIIW